MKILKTTLFCLLLLALGPSLFSKSLKIAETVLVNVPAGWTYMDSKSYKMSNLGTLHSAFLENSNEGRKLTCSVLKVPRPIVGFRYSTAIVEAALSPLIQEHRSKGSVIGDRKLLWIGDNLFYSQRVRTPQAKIIELRGVIFKNDDDWINFLGNGEDTIDWSFYGSLIEGSRKLN